MSMPNDKAAQRAREALRRTKVEADEDLRDAEKAAQRHDAGPAEEAALDAALAAVREAAIADLDAKLAERRAGVIARRTYKPLHARARAVQDVLGAFGAMFPERRPETDPIRDEARAAEKDVAVKAEALEAIEARAKALVGAIEEAAAPEAIEKVRKALRGSAERARIETLVGAL